MGIKTVEYNKKYDCPIVLCMGFFDCLHKGHVKLIDKAKQIAGYTRAQVALFTFDNNPAPLLGKKENLILTYNERVFRASQLGIDCVISAHYDKHFQSILPSDFLEILAENFDIKAIVAGKDYTFGYGGAGDSNVLKNYFEKQGILVDIVDLLKITERKIASRDIRMYLKSGEIQSVNSFMSLPYFAMGEVVHGREVGKALGFPTANIYSDKDKEVIAAGVYYTRVCVDGTYYNGMTNVGTHPTFNDYNNNIETYLLDYNGDLYGKIIYVEFIKKIRGIIKFSSKEELILQLSNDVKAVREIAYD